MNYVGIAWIVLLVLLIVIEIATLGLTTIWFAGGALVALFANLCGLNIVVQLVLFVVVSGLLLYFTRPIMIRYIKMDRVKTNVDSLVGQTGIVREDIDNLQAMGCVVVNGQEWTARSTDDALITAGKVVIIDAIQGVKLIVREKK